MKLFVAFIGCLFMGNVFAQAIFPKGCQPVVLADGPIKLTSKKATVAMIYNASAADLWVTHPETEPSASAGWSTQLHSHHWAALAFEGKPFELSCIESRPGHEQEVTCASVLSICQWKKIKLPKSAVGNFWAGEDMPLARLLSHLGERGIIVPSLAQ